MERDRKRKWKRKHESGREIGVEEFAYLSPRRRTPKTQHPTRSPPPLLPCNPKTELTFLTMKMKICASCYLLRLQFSCSFFAQTKKYVGCASVCMGVCVCGFVKSASVISVRLNGAKQTWAKNSDRKRPQRGPKKFSSWTCFMWVLLCSARKREKESKTEREWVLEIK